MRWLGTLMLAAVVGLGGSAKAAGGLVTGFDVDNVKSAIAAAGGEFVEVANADSGAPAVVYRFGGRTYFAFLGLCKTGKCGGVELVGSFSTKDVTIPLTAVNQYNFNHADGKAIYVASTPSLDTARFLNANGGITIENMAWEIQHFHGLTDALVEEMKTANIVASSDNSAKLKPTSAPAGAPVVQGHNIAQPRNVFPH